MKEKDILKRMFFKCQEFKPLLNQKQYAVYIKHLKEVINLCGVEIK